MLHSIEFKTTDEDSLIIVMDGQEIGNYSYDSIGFSGLQAVERLMEAVAWKLDVPILRTCVESDE